MPERHDQGDARHRADAGHRDRQRQVDGTDDQRDDEGEPEGRERVQPAGQAGGGPAQPIERLHPTRVDRLQRRGIQALVGMLDGIGIEAQGRSQLRHRRIGEDVLRAQQLRDSGAHARVVGHEVGPVRGITLEVPDRRADGKVAAQRQRFQERPLALGGRALAEHDRDDLRSGGQQVRRPVLDRVEQRGGAASREPARRSSSRENRADPSDATTDRDPGSCPCRRGPSAEAQPPVHEASGNSRCR